MTYILLIYKDAVFVIYKTILYCRDRSMQIFQVLALKCIFWKLEILERKKCCRLIYLSLTVPPPWLLPHTFWAFTKNNISYLYLSLMFFPVFFCYSSVYREKNINSIINAQSPFNIQVMLALLAWPFHITFSFFPTSFI